MAKLVQEIDTLTYDFCRKERRRKLNQFVRFELLGHLTMNLIIDERSIFFMKNKHFLSVRLLGVLFIVLFAFLMFSLAFNTLANLSNHNDEDKST